MTDAIGPDAGVGVRVLVCGGRDYGDGRAVDSALNAIHVATPISCVIEGGAKGADYLACLWSARNSIADHARFNADWTLHGKAAGPIRNQRMIDEGKPDLVIAFSGGVGTRDCVSRARKAGIKVIEVTP